ncbi:MAG: family 10 glycosylhydrolase [Candidatus Neomarinimicrobiota bacterium]
MKRISQILLFIILGFSTVFSQSAYPKREFRGVWIASVTNLDWPSSPNRTVQQQKDELTALLDVLSNAGINAIVFQIRPECDAFYISSIEPWSYWLTGLQGRAPSPLYDPLEFAIQEAHRRGMELHAWFNPYRAEKVVGDHTIAANHVTRQHTDWVITKGTYKFLNPGLPDVRNYVTSIVMDVVSRYDIDGVHFDDYFYPYDGMSGEDAAIFSTYPRGFTNIADWRRDNVNLLVKQVYDSIQAVKPFVKFGISPFGIWKSGVPSGISGMSAYSDIYCDAVAWLNAQTVDYITPQCYWAIGGGQDYSKLVPWWASVENGRHLYPGQIFKTSGTQWSAAYTAEELPNQVRINRNTAGVYGNILFRASFLSSNTFGFANFLANDFHRYPALLPQMAWKDTTSPNAPTNLKYNLVADRGEVGFSWDLPATASDGDSASRYAFYRFDFESIHPDSLQYPENLTQIVGERFFQPNPDTENGPFYYVVTALDRNWNESGMSNVVRVDPPTAPLAVSPIDLATDQRDTVELSWSPTDLSSQYDLTIATDSLFSADVVQYDGLTDSFIVLTTLNGEQQYFWQVRTYNAGGTSDYSKNSSFTTGFPAVPVLVYPSHGTTEMPQSVTVTWHPNEKVTAYRIQVSRSGDFGSSYIVLDSSGVTDTTFTINNLLSSKYYCWHVNACNAFGTSKWATTWRFKTAAVSEVADVGTMPVKYELYQNRPNPFNPTTEIQMVLPRDEFVTMRVFDLTGRLVCVLANERLSQGNHTFYFDGSRLPSAIYFYQMDASGFHQTRKMILVR